MGVPDKHDNRGPDGKSRLFEHLAKVDKRGVVIAMVEVDASSDWPHWTDAEGHRYVYLTDLLPIDLHGLQLLSALPIEKHGA